MLHYVEYTLPSKRHFATSTFSMTYLAYLIELSRRRVVALQNYMHIYVRSPYYAYVIARSRKAPFVTCDSVAPKRELDIPQVPRDRDDIYAHEVLRRRFSNSEYCTGSNRHSRTNATIDKQQ